MCLSFKQILARFSNCSPQMTGQITFKFDFKFPTFIKGEELNYKSVSKGAKRLIIRQRLHAGLLAGRGRSSNMAGKSNL